MFVVAHASDTHFGNDVQDPADRAAAVMDHLLAMRPRPDVLVVICWHGGRLALACGRPFAANRGKRRDGWVAPVLPLRVAFSSEQAGDYRPRAAHDVVGTVDEAPRAAPDRTHTWAIASLHAPPTDAHERKKARGGG